uniref:DinB-like domain-containing protein n=1 Tax=Peronospora matthiolae TaxID=2874970 RepID=A0AAV1UWC7_9STRA
MRSSRVVARFFTRTRMAHTNSAAADSAGTPMCVLAILGQHEAFLHSLDDAVYTFHSPLVNGSVGQHTRHSLDHLRMPLELMAAQQEGRSENVVHYDVRDRHTLVEKDRHVALEQIKQLRKTLRGVSPTVLTQPVHAAFMLSADGREFAFESTFNRELAFAVHHCIHHNAMSKVLLSHHFPRLRVPEGFGMAPSTASFNLTHPQE